MRFLSFFNKWLGNQKKLIIFAAHFYGHIVTRCVFILKNCWFVGFNM